MHNILKLLADDTTTNRSRVTPTSSAGSTGLIAPTKDTNLLDSVTGIINSVIAILGFVCVVVMIVGGVNYMTSAGDTNKVTKAKNTILYGLIGLVICVLSFAIVNFVINNIIAGK